MNADIALNYLQQNQVKHMDMIVPIKRNTAKILHAGNDGVLLHETKSSAFMLSVTDHPLGLSLMDMLPESGLFVCHQNFMIDDFRARFKTSKFLENHQAVYFGTTPLPLPKNLNFRTLTMDDLPLVSNAYVQDLGEEYIAGRIAEKELFGGFLDGQMVGFVGIHEEGSMGLLQVFEGHGGKGYGTALYAYITNHQIKLGSVPFAQIGISNKPSLAIAQKLGFEICKDSVWWTW